VIIWANTSSVLNTGVIADVSGNILISLMFFEESSSPDYTMLRK
jgi:hypothetical protein